MSTRKVCVIRNLNDLNEKHNGIDDIHWNQKDLSHYSLKEKIEDFVDFIEVLNIEDLLNLISYVIQPSNKYILNIDDFYYTSDYVYQAIFKLPETNNKSYSDQLDESNKLAIQLLNEKFFINGNMIILKRSIINNDFDYVNISMDDITDILRQQFLHKAIIIKPNANFNENINQISESTYMYNALEINFDQTHLDNSRFFEFRFLDYRLFFHIDKQAARNDNNLNILASIIYGKKIYGNVLLSLCDNSDDSPRPLDMTIDLFRQIFYIGLYQQKSNTLVDRKKYTRNFDIENKDLLDNKQKDNNRFIHNNFPEIILCPNFYYVIKNEYRNLNMSDLNINDLNINDFQSVLNDIE
jgi:hypothetical protein